MTATLLVAWLLSQAPAAAPVDVILMVDVSRSVSYGLIRRDRRLLPDAGGALASAVQPGDAVRIGTFGTEILLNPAPLLDGAAIRNEAESLAERAGGASPIWDALLAASRALGDSGTRRGIVVVTDGRSSGNRVGFAEMVERLQRARIPVFVVSLDKGGEAFPDPGARLTQLANATGGTCLYVERPAMAPAIVRSIGTLRAGLSGTAR